MVCAWAFVPPHTDTAAPHPKPPPPSVRTPRMAWLPGLLQRALAGRRRGAGAGAWRAGCGGAPAATGSRLAVRGTAPQPRQLAAPSPPPPSRAGAPRCWGKVPLCCDVCKARCTRARRSYARTLGTPSGLVRAQTSSRSEHHSQQQPIEGTSQALLPSRTPRPAASLPCALGGLCSRKAAQKGVFRFFVPGGNGPSNGGWLQVNNHFPPENWGNKI